MTKQTNVLKDTITCLQTKKKSVSSATHVVMNGWWSMSTFHHKATITVYIMRDSSSNTLKQKEIEVWIDLYKKQNV